MRDYKLTRGHDSPYTFHLEPVDGDSHHLCFTNEDSAHQFKLALALGTFPDPIQGPRKWRMIDDITSILCYLPTEYLPKEEPPDGCCQSGCQGCPDYRG